MGALINFKLELHKLDKAKIIKGKKGNYYDITISLGEETDQFGNNAKAFDVQSKEDRESGKPRNYVGNGQVFWTDGKIVTVERKEAAQQQQAPVANVDLPF